MGTVGLALVLGLLLIWGDLGFARERFEIRPVVQEGTVAPTGAPFASFGDLRINGRGDILFEALTGERRALFVASQGRTIPIAVEGERTPLGGRYLQLSYFVLNDRGEVAFVATIGRARRERRRPAAAILRGPWAQIKVFAKVRDAAPKVGFFKEFRDLALDQAGRLAFVASLSDSDRPGGLFISAGKGMERLVAVLDPAPIGGRFKEVSAPSVGPGGRVAFHATVVRDAGLRPGLFVVGPSGLHKVVAIGDPSPLGGTFTQFAKPVLNRDGKLYFWGEVDGGRFPAGLFFADRGEIVSVASRGAPSPAGPPYSYFGLTFSAQGHLAFQASLDGPGPKAAIFLSGRDGTVAVVRAGDPCPTGGAFSSFGDPAANARGEVAFVGSAEGREGIYLALPRVRP